MPKTLATMATEVRDHLDEATAAFWTDAQIRKWINEALRDVSRRSEALLATQTKTIVAGTQTYTLDTQTVVRVNRAQFEPTGQTTIYPLEYRDFIGMDEIWGIQQAITQSYPQYFTFWGYPPSLQVTLYPVPSVGGVLRLYYYKLATELATDGTGDASNVDIVEGWYDLVLYYAEATALRKDGDQRWQEAAAKYESMLQTLIENTRRWSDQAGVIEFAGAGGLPQWLVSGEGWW